jgi:steroid delta-isomerase-like uncharacterized protein
VSRAEHEERLRAAVAAWNEGDLDRYLELYDEGIRLHGYSPEPMDKTAVRGFYQGVFAAFPGCRLTLHDVLGEGDEVATRFTLTGRHEGEFLGVPATGREVAVDGITILRFRDGRCVERWSSADMLGWLVQLGAIPPPG